MTSKPWRLAAAALFAGLALAPNGVRLLGAGSRNEATLETLLVQLELERRGRSDDVEELERLTTQIARSEGQAAQARGRLVQALRDGDLEPAGIGQAEETIAEAEARVRAGEERRRAVASRLVERGRRIAFLSDEVTRRRSGRSPTDPLTGRWEVVVNPGPRRGVYRLVLDGTLVSGDYGLDGGFRGSLRGTLVGERVTLQRIDAERGFDATFYGRVNAQQKRITGTWEATTLAPTTGPTAGTWVANLLPERDDGATERP